jgi:cysteine-rich repeat protein
MRGRLEAVLAACAAISVAASCSKDFDQFFETAVSSTGVAGGTTGPGPGGNGGSPSASGGSGPTTTTGGGGAGAQGGVGAQGGGGAQGGMGGNGGNGGSAPCGNGVLDSGEECDDADAVSADGCSGSCELEGQADMCPSGVGIALDPPGIWITDTTVGKATGNNTTCGGNSAGDVAYQISPSQNGMVTVELTGAYDKVLAVREVCQSGGLDDFCDTGAGTLTTQVAAMQGQDFHAIVSGLSGAEGTFVLHVFY